MRYRKMDLSQLKKYYGRYARPDENGKGIIIPRGGKNHGEDGKPNLKYHIEFCGALFDKDNNEVDVTMGFKIHDLIADFYHDFDDDTVIIPGSKITHDHHSSKSKHFYVTLNPNNVNFAMIGCKRYHGKDPTTKELSDLAIFACLGELENATYCWDYFVFPWTLDYNKVANRDDVLLSDAKYAACNKTKARREMLRKFLEEKFDNIDTMIALSSIYDTKQEFDKMKMTCYEISLQQNNLPELLQQWHYRDELNHKETFVIDEEGCMISPDSTVPWDDGKKYCNADISTSNNWHNIPKNYAAIRYVRRGISCPAHYLFLQKPDKITDAQYDAILILEQTLRNEVRQLLGKYDLIDRLALRGAEETWSKKLQK